MTAAFLTTSKAKLANTVQTVFSLNSANKNPFSECNSNRTSLRSGEEVELTWVSVVLITLNPSRMFCKWDGANKICQRLFLILGQNTAGLQGNLLDKMETGFARPLMRFSFEWGRDVQTFGFGVEQIIVFFCYFRYRTMPIPPNLGFWWCHLNEICTVSILPREMNLVDGEEIQFSLLPGPWVERNLATFLLEICRSICMLHMTHGFYILQQSGWK